MTVTADIRDRLRELGFKPSANERIERLGLELTVCQFIVVVFSLVSVVFLFTPLFFLQNVRFMIIFFGISIVCLGAGVWFWSKKADICEHPEDYD